MQALSLSIQHLKDREAFKQKLINFQVKVLLLVQPRSEGFCFAAVSSIQVGGHGYFTSSLQVNGS